MDYAQQKEDYKNAYLKKPPKRLAVVDQNGCNGCAGSPVCVAFCETVTVRDQVVDAIRVVKHPDSPFEMAVIDYEKCIGCALCSEVCPWETIHMHAFGDAWDTMDDATLVTSDDENLVARDRSKLAEQEAAAS